MKLHLENINKAFKDKEVLSGVNFIFEDSKIHGLLGRNGSGKTTLFNIIYNELEADSGKILIEEDGVKRALTPDDIGMVFTDVQLPDLLTGYEFIKFYIDINKKRIPDLQTIDYYFDLLEMNEKDRHLLIADYSHGMKSKLSLLMILITKPKVILLDEPLTDIDVVISILIKELLKDISSGRIILFSTHILQLAKDLCDDIVILHNKQLQGIDISGDPAQFEQLIVDALKEEN